MRIRLLPWLLGVALAAGRLGAQAPPTPLGPMLANPHLARPGLLAGGAPGAAEGYLALAADGYRTFVDLRGDAERPADAQAFAEAAGLAYVRVPVTGEVDLDLVSARALDAVLDDAARGPVVVACHSGNRSAALIAVREFWLEGAGAEAALALGKAAGLTRLEPSVRMLLGLPPATPALLAPAPAPAPTSSRRRPRGSLPAEPSGPLRAPDAGSGATPRRGRPRGRRGTGRARARRCPATRRWPGRSW